MILIVGLGNPGEHFQLTRHNIGFSILDEITNRFEFPAYKKKFNGSYTKKRVLGTEIILFKPTNFMNLSGEPTSKIVNFYKIAKSKDLIVIHDDLDMELGKIRVKFTGSHGGHNGIKDIIKFLGEEFIRIKIGIKNNLIIKKKISSEKFVLQNFKNSEILLINKLKKDIIKNFYLIIEKKFPELINDIRRK